MIFTILTGILMFVMISYMFRHLIFTYQALFSRPQHFLGSFERIVGVYTPKVTILIPAHNEQFVIGKILERMTELTYPKDKLEVIVIDDGSTDATGEIADDYADKYEYIKVLSLIHI